MKQQFSKILALATIVLLCAGVASASSMWLHVRVEEDGGAKVKVNVPISMVEKALTMVPDRHLRHARIELDDCCHEWSAEDMRELWQEIKNSPDMTFVTVEEDDEKVKVWKEAGHLLVQVREHGDQEVVDVKVPLRVVDALLSGSDEEKIDLEGAVRALAEEGAGDLVTVSSQDEKVRVWIDEIAEAD